MNPYFPLIRIVAWLLVVLGIAGVGAWAGHRLTSDYYVPRLDAAQKNTELAQAANTQLRAAVQQQNDAMDDLVKRAQQREQAAEAAQATAAAAAESYQKKAAAILASRPLGTDECRAASQAFDEELRQERSMR